MGDILSEKQKAERLVAGARVSLALLFVCPACGHANRPARNKLQAVKMYLLDQLPDCRKCGSKLRKGNVDPCKIPKPLLKRAEAELSSKRLINCPECSQKLLAPTDRGTLKLRCRKCKAEFEFTP